MSDLDDYDVKINEDLDRMQKEIEKLSQKDQTAKNNAMKRLLVTRI